MSKENRETILSEVKKIICDDRNEQYGEPEDSFIDAIGYMTCATDIEYPKSTNWEKTNADN